MKKLLATAAVLLIPATHALAWSCSTATQCVGDNGVGYYFATTAQAQQWQRQQQTQTQGQSQKQSALGGSGGSLYVNSPPGPINNPGGFGMANCGWGLGIGLGLGGSGSAGGTLGELTECKVGREAMQLGALGNPVAGIIEMCNEIDRVKRAYGGVCPKIDQVAVVLPTPLEAVSMPLVVAEPCLPPMVVWQDGSCHHKTVVPVKKKVVIPCICDK